MPEQPTIAERLAAAERASSEHDRGAATLQARTEFLEWDTDALRSHVLHLAECVQVGETDTHPRLPAELAAAAGTLQQLLNSGRPRRGALPNSGDPATDLMRRVGWEGDGFLAVTAGTIRSTFGQQLLSGYSLATLPTTLPADDDQHVVLYSPLAPVADLLTKA
jgi:hypothetical protein